MNIVIYGASGMIGQRITREALARGHRVTAVIRNPAHFTFSHENLKVKQGNILDSGRVAQTVAGYTPPRYAQFSCLILAHRARSTRCIGYLPHSRS